MKGIRGEDRVLRVLRVSDARTVGYGEVRFGGRIGVVVEVVEV